MTRITRWLTLIPLALLALAAACSSGNNNSSGNSNSRASGSAVSTGATLSDCTYRDKVLAAFDSIQSALSGPQAFVTAGPTGVDAATKANVSKVLDSIITGLNQSVASLQKVTPPSDFKAFNASVITAFQNTTKQVTDAKTALAAGDISKADALFSGSGTFGDEFSNIDKQYPALSARLDACPSPTP